MVIISLISMYLAGVCNAFMDRLMIKFMLLPTDKQNNELNPKWFSFNPRVKWENGKYNTRKAYNYLFLKIGIKTRWLSDNCNDGWHFMKSLMVIFLCLSVVIFSTNFILSNITSYIILFLVYGSCWILGFNLIYKNFK